MTLKHARAMAGMTTWASHSREDVDTALAIVTRALDGAEAERDAYLRGWVRLRAWATGLKSLSARGWILNAIDDALGAKKEQA
jgi:hypothetical protein